MEIEKTEKNLPAGPGNHCPPGAGIRGRKGENMTDFVHLHIHSHFSLGKSAPSVEELVASAAFHGMKHLALTDQHSMAGIPLFVQACEKAGIHPIIGCDVDVAFVPKEIGMRCHIVLLAANAEGYRNLLKIVSSSYTPNSARQKIDGEILAKYSGGLIGLLVSYHSHEGPLLRRQDDIKLSCAPGGHRLHIHYHTLMRAVWEVLCEQSEFSLQKALWGKFG
jgi:DNA polymerase-3 subunit alpha